MSGCLLEISTAITARREGHFLLRNPQSWINPRDTSASKTRANTSSCYPPSFVDNGDRFASEKIWETLYLGENVGIGGRIVGGRSEGSSF